MARVFYRKGKSGGHWYADYEIDGKRIRKMLGATNKKEAESALNVILSDIFRGEYRLQPKRKNILLEKFFAEYLVYSQENKSKTSFSRDKTIANNFIKFIGPKGLRSINPFDVEKYKHERLKSVTKPTINRELDTIKNLFKKAVQWGYLKENPASTVLKFKLQERPYTIIDPDDEKLLLDHASDHLKTAVIIALNTGMRLTEILNLNCEDVDFAIRVITIKETKNKTIRKVNMNSLLTDHLKHVIDNSNTERVISYKGNGLASVKNAFKKAIKRAGIKKIRFHDLRHTFASRAVMMGVDIRTVQELLGHKDLRMTMKYSHPTEDHKARAVEAVQNFGTNMAQIRNEKNSKPVSN